MQYASILCGHVEATSKITIEEKISILIEVLGREVTTTNARPA